MGDLPVALEPAVLALGWTLIHAVWQSALVAAAYALLRLVLRAPRARVALGHAALFALAGLPLLTFLQRMAETAPAGPTGEADLMIVSALAAANAGGADFEAWLPWLVLGWLGGVCVLCLRQVWQWRELRRLVRRAAPLDAEWQQRFEALKTRMGVRFKVGLRHSAEVALPMLVGILRPTILMPAGLVLRLPADRVELILLHELAHLRRLDPIFNLLQTVVETLLFYHPAVHWVSRRLREDRELCCDEIVLANGADPLRYARVLLTLAEAQPVPTPALALAATGGELMQRIERIVDLPRAGQSAPRAFGPVGVMLGVALVGAVLLQDQARWAALEPLPWGFGHVRLNLPQWQWTPQVTDLAPRIETMPLQSIAPELRSALDGVDVPMPLPLPPAARSAALAPGATTLAALPAAASNLPRPEPMLERVQAEAAPMPLQRLAPEYPAVARELGREGWVRLSYRIDGTGRAVDIEVVGAQLEGEFEQAARAALRQWRFHPSAASAEAQHVRFDFRLDGGAAAAAPVQGDAVSAPMPNAEVVRSCARVTGSRLCRPMRAGGTRTTVLSAG